MSREEKRSLAKIKAEFPGTIREMHALYDLIDRRLDEEDDRAELVEPLISQCAEVIGRILRSEGA